jgi:ligand-binding sensor domain-containing protein
LPSDDVLDLCASGPRVWVATAAGLCRVEAHAIQRVPLAEAPRLLAPAPDGAVYALLATEIVRVGDRVEERIPLPVDPARGAAEAMMAEPDGLLWLRIDRESYRWDGAWRPGAAHWPQVAARPIPHLAETWRPTRGRGILRRRDTPYFRRHEIPGAARVHALARAPDGTIWCGTNHGLARVRGDRVETILAIAGRELGDVTACAVDRDGRVWIGSGSAFTGVYRRGPDGWRHLGAIDGFVHRITTDPAGALWFAVLNAAGQPPAETRGAWYFSDGEFKPGPANVELPSARVYDVVARDPTGVLWFATLKGLAAYEGPHRVTHYTPETIGLRSEKVWCLCAGRDGSLWIGYQKGRGVSRLVRGRITHYDVEVGLCDDKVWSIAEGRPGVFWFATEHGLSRYDGRRWSCFREEEGLGRARIWPLLPLDDGSLWIGTLGEGLVHLVPGDHTPPRTRFDADGYEGREGGPVTVSWRGTDAWFDTPAAELRYRWRLDRARWSPVSARTRVAISATPGHHIVAVQAIDRFGNAEDPPATVRLEVLAARSPFPWLPLLGAAVLLVAVGFWIGRRGRRRG